MTGVLVAYRHNLLWRYDAGVFHLGYRGFLPVAPVKQVMMRLP
jgi:hypothetical protein